MWKHTFEVDGGLHSVKECNCSLCGRLGALRRFVPRIQARFITPESNLSTYRFGRRIIKHRFCAIRGCATMGTGSHYGVDMSSIDARRLEDANLPALRIKAADGRSFPAS